MSIIHCIILNSCSSCVTGHTQTKQPWDTHGCLVKVHDYFLEWDSWHSLFCLAFLNDLSFQLIISMLHVQKQRMVMYCNSVESHGTNVIKDWVRKFSELFIPVYVNRLCYSLYQVLCSVHILTHLLYDLWRRCSFVNKELYLFIKLLNPALMESLSKWLGRLG